MKEKIILRKKFIISIIIVILLAVGVILYAFLAPKTITGSWELVINPETAQATPDEAENSQNAYYSFSAPGEYGDGSYKTYYSGGIEEGTYKLSERDGERLINLGTQDLVYSITGSKLFGTAKLTITYTAYTDEETGQEIPAQDYVFAQAKAPEYEKCSYTSFDTDPALLREWTTDERTLSYYVYEIPYTETVSFLDNGIMTIHYESEDLALDRVMYYAYTVGDNTLTFSLVTDKETEYAVFYTIDAEGNLRFTEDTTSSSIFADAFFSDVTYYTQDHLLEDNGEEITFDQ